MCYEQSRYDLGCPRSGLCETHAKVGKEVPCSVEAGCKNFVEVEGVPEEFDALYLPRLRLITRLEGMVVVGCTFRIDDLDADVWDQLIVLKGERNRMEADVMKLRSRQDAPGPVLDAEETRAVEEARKAGGVPAPGQSLFR